MNTTKKLNVKLLRRVKRHILAEPKRIQMDTLIEKGKPNTRFTTNFAHNVQVFPSCGTAACIAGWTCILSGVPKSRICASKAAKLLNLTDGDLFFVFEWPEPFGSRYRKARKAERRAKIVADRIEHLIKTGE